MRTLIKVLFTIGILVILAVAGMTWYRILENSAGKKEVTFTYWLPPNYEIATSLANSESQVTYNRVFSKELFLKNAESNRVQIIPDIVRVRYYVKSGPGRGYLYVANHDDGILWGMRPVGGVKYDGNGRIKIKCERSDFLIALNIIFYSLIAIVIEFVIGIILFVSFSKMGLLPLPKIKPNHNREKEKWIPKPPKPAGAVTGKK